MSLDARALALADEQSVLEELGWVRTIAERLLSDPNDAEDIVQEAWLRTRDSDMRFESRGRLRAWLSGVARRMARDTLRARRRRAAREEAAARQETHYDAGDVVARSAMLERLLRAVRAMEEPQRSTVLLRYLDGHSMAEIAATHGVSEEVVRKRLSRARERLRIALSEHPEATRWIQPAPPPRQSALRASSVAGLLVLAFLGAKALWMPVDFAAPARPGRLPIADRAPADLPAALPAAEDRTESTEPESPVVADSQGEVSAQEESATREESKESSPEAEGLVPAAELHPSVPTATVEAVVE